MKKKNASEFTSVNNDSLVTWIKGMMRAQGHGAKTKVASNLGISPSGLSKILTRSSGFDDKTVRLMSWIMSSKAEHYPNTKVIVTIEADGLVWEQRKIEGEIVWTWRAKT